MMSYQTSNSTLRYNAKDAFITLECADAFMEELDNSAFEGQPNFRSTYDHTIDLLAPLMYMMSRGIKINHEKLKATQTKVGKRIEEIREELNKMVGYEINPASPAQLKEYFYVRLGIPPYTKRNNKNESSITTDDKALQRLARGTSVRKGRPEARLVQEFRKLSKLKGTYLDMRFDSDARMRCTYNPRGTRFARVSSGTTIFDTGMNMQNLPPAFQDFMVADDGCLFIDIDKAKAEWVVMAYISSDEGMIGAIESGIDVHSWTASHMFGLPLELVLKEDKIIQHESDPNKVLAHRKEIPELAEAIQQRIWLPRAMSLRQCGKKANHGLNYDEGAGEFGLQNEITEKESKVIVDFYHRTYPGIKRYYEHVQGQLQSNGRVLTNLFGRPYRFLGKWDNKLFKAAYSFVPQSTVGELINRAIVDIYKSQEPKLKNVEIMRQVHDNISFQVPLDDPHLGEIVQILEKHMNPELKAGGRSFHIESDMKVGFSLGDMESVPFYSDPVEQAKAIRKAVDGKEKSWGLAN